MNVWLHAFSFARRTADLARQVEAWGLDGMLVAAYTHLVVDPNWLPSFIGGTRIGRMEQIAGSFTMASSSLCPGG